MKADFWLPIHAFWPSAVGIGETNFDQVETFATSTPTIHKSLCVPVNNTSQKEITIGYQIMAVCCAVPQNDV